ncbi:MAG: PQQ-binding-like beta-propeller repeat protein [Firmicutes bacterium]|nr:PQQ-binding-like beta-propeller repeat protein [Bacillota bacterium]
MFIKMKALLISALALCLALGLLPPPPAAATGQPGATLDWTRSFGWDMYEKLRIDDIPAVDREGNVYATCQDGHLYCVRPDRTLKWKVDLGQKGAAMQIGGLGPALDRAGNCYISSGNKNVYAIGPGGNIIWTFTMNGEPAPGTSPALAGDTLYVANKNGYLYALNKNSGEKRWKLPFKGAWGCNTPVISPADGTVYVGSDTWVTAVAVNPDDDTGTVLWERNMQQDAGDHTRYVYMQNIPGGTKFEKRMAAGADGTLYLVTTNFKGAPDLAKNRLYALDPGNGHDKWVRDVNRHLSAPVVRGDNLYYTCENDGLYALDAATGAEKWHYLPDDVLGWNHLARQSPVTGPDGTVYAPVGGNLHALTPDGEEIWSFLGGAAHIVTVSEPGTRGELYCVAAMDGHNKLLKLTDTAISVEPGQLVLAHRELAMLPGGRHNPEASLLDTYGHTMDTRGLRWASSNAGVADVDAGGQVKAVAPGEAEITVSHPDNADLTAAARVEVLPGLAGVSLQITPAAPQVLTGRQMALQATFTAPGGKVVKGETVEWTSDALPVATVSPTGELTGQKPGQAVIRARNQSRPELRAEVTVTVKGHEIPKVNRQDIKTAIGLTIGYYTGKEVPGDWEAFALNAAGEDVLKFTSQGQTYLQKLSARINDSGVGSLLTDYERTALAIVSAGGDPTDFAGIDFINTIADWDNLSQGINAAIWGLIALDGAGAVVPAGAKNTREDFIDYILKNRSGVGWAFGGGNTPDVDMTGMALYALAPYKDRPAVKAAGEKAILWLSENQLNDGKFASWGTINSTSLSQAIMGVTAWGIDPQGPQFTKKNGNAVTALLSYHTQNGMFKHISAPEPRFATVQGLQALAALDGFFDKGKSTIFYKIQPAGDEPREISALEIDPQSLEMEISRGISLSIKNQNGISLPVESVIWTVSDQAVAQIDNRGTVHTRKEGTVNIIATLKDDDGIKDQARLAVVAQDFEIAKADSSDVVSGPDKNLAVRVKNVSDTKKSAVISMVLYDESNRKIIHKSYIAKDFAPGETHVIGGGFHIPDEGEYVTKIMVWNDWLKGRPLQEAIID